MANFNDIIGQEKLKEHLISAILTSNISHAYIISGERSMGKEFIAKIFATSIQCENPVEAQPCNQCHSCCQAVTDNHPDIIFLTHEKPGIISVDDIRSQINSDIGIKPYQSEKKIYVISEAEKMTPQAQNALLKTFEEPPAYAIIILLTANAEALLPTILSRAIILNMKPVPDDMVKEYLMKVMEIPDYKADICVAFARGNIGKARLLAVSEEFEKVKDQALSLLKNIGGMEINEIIAAIKMINEYKFDVGDYLDILSIWYRDVLLFKATRDLSHLIFKEEYHYIKRVADTCAYEGIEEVIEALEKAKIRLKANVNFELTLELLLLTIKESEK
ncbi:MAG: DNA polymerase III subunit [Lachnospiraceae bacterium]|nr:DNA polymerase III subunit [Lachnospiraceae bacterium]